MVKRLITIFLTFIVINFIFMGIYFYVFLANGEEETKNLIIEQKIEKFLNINENNILLQQSVEISTEEKKEYQTIQIKIPEIENQIGNVKAILVNGKKIGEEKYKINENIIEIRISEEDNLFDKTKEVYKIIYEYTKEDIKETEEIELLTTVETKIKNKEIIKNENESKVEVSQKGSIISLVENKNEPIYKGYLYNGIETEFDEKYDIEISDIENAEQIVIENKEAKYLTQENNEEIEISKGTIYYKSTKINKNEMIDILGEDGKIIIENENGEVIQQIDKNTTVDENGIFTINYDNVEKIKIVITQPIKEGTIHIENSKIIKKDSSYKKEQREEIKQLKILKQEVLLNDTLSNIEYDLLEPKTKAKLEINKNTLSTMNDNEEIELKIILQANNETTKLYENPEIKIILPQEIEEVKLIENIQLLYEEDLEIESYKIDGREINIKLKGSQKEYKQESILGSILNLKLKINLNKNTTNILDKILVIVKNQEEEIEISEDINIIYPREIITTNCIEEFNFQTYGEEQLQGIELEKDKDTQYLNVKSKIINNTASQISNIKILGDFPTDGERKVENKTIHNNLSTNIIEEIKSEGKNVKIYYTDNIEATQDIDKQENRWRENDLIPNAKKYMILIDEMAPNEEFRFNYRISIPGNLEYNKQAVEGYSVSYTKNNQQSENKILSTYISTYTGNGPKLEVEFFTADGDWYERQIKDIKIRIKNLGEKAIEDIEFKFLIPEGVKYAVEDKESQEIIEKEEREIIQNIEKLEAGETYEIDYKIVIQKLNLEEREIEFNVEARVNNFDDVFKSETVKRTVKKSKIQARKTKSYTDDTILQYNTAIFYGIEVENISNETLYNIKITDVIQKELEYIQSSYNVPGQGGIIEPNNQYDEETRTVTWNIDNLKPGEKRRVTLQVRVKKIEEDVTIKNVAIIETEDGQRIETNEVSNIASIPKFEIIKKSSIPNNSYIKELQNFEYYIQIKNVGVNQQTIELKDIVPEGLTVKGYSYRINNGEEIIQKTGEHEIIISTMMYVGDILDLTIEVQANILNEDEVEKKITNKANLKVNVFYELASNEITHIIEKDPSLHPNEENENKFKISGRVWNDVNKNGKREPNENGISNIKVKILDTNSNQLIDNIEITTENNGEYVIDNLKNGNYIVIFYYNTKDYGVTSYQKEGIEENLNSDAIERNFEIDNISLTMALTDIIEINDKSISSIDLGLYNKEKFDLSLEKNIDKITVTNSKGSKVYLGNGQKINKIEIKPKEVNETIVQVDYEIIVRNEGEIDGYAKKVYDYLPEGFKFDLKTNTNWRLEDEKLVNTSLENTLIKVGESKSIHLILTKELKEDKLGSFVNIAEIGEAYNKEGIEDYNSIPGNKKQNENDMSDVTLIISVGTGKIVTYIILIMTCVGILGIGIYFLKKKVI